MREPSRSIPFLPYQTKAVSSPWLRAQTSAFKRQRVRSSEKTALLYRDHPQPISISETAASQKTPSPSLKTPMLMLLSNKHQSPYQQEIASVKRNRLEFESSSTYLFAPEKQNSDSQESLFLYCVDTTSYSPTQLNYLIKELQGWQSLGMAIETTQTV